MSRLMRHRNFAVWQGFRRVHASVVRVLLPWSGSTSDCDPVKKHDFVKSVIHRDVPMDYGFRKLLRYIHDHGMTVNAFPIQHISTADEPIHSPADLTALVR